LNQDLTAEDLSHRLGKQRIMDRAVTLLPQAGFTDNAEGLAFIDREADPVNGRNLAGIRVEKP
jgi:hypothetical protein